MKRCSKCGLSVDEGAVFGKHKGTKDGLRCDCNKCRSNAQKQYYRTEHGKEIIRKYQQTEKAKKAKKEHQQSEKGRETKRRYRQLEGSKEADRVYQRSERGRELQKQYRQSAKYKKTRISDRLSCAIRRSLKGNKNGRHWETLTGWTFQQFKRRFVQLFKHGMTWENHGKVWEIDHIVPLSAHNITSSECTDFKRAWALSNLQPLFKEENQSKHNKLEKHFQLTLF